MLKLNTRMGSCNRRYYVYVNDKGYYVEDIVFYQDDKPLVSSGRGWLENAERCDIWNIELPVDTIKLKRKAVFNTRDVYILSTGKNIHGELTAVLYIPADMLNIKFAEHFLRSYRVFWKSISRLLTESWMSFLQSMNRHIEMSMFTR